MSKFISTLAVTVFFVWILPLGVFIKPSEEKKFCGGQRAICLCSHHLNESKSKGIGKAMIVNSQGINKESGGPGGGHHFVLNDIKDIPSFFSSNYFEKESSQYSLLVSRSIEHIPKT